MCSCVGIHFLNLSDGSPYCALPRPNFIAWQVPQRALEAVFEGLAITSSRVMLHVCSSVDEGWIGAIFVWDWKTKDLVRHCGPSSHGLFTSPSQVLEFPPACNGMRVCEDTEVFFLDEFRMVILTPRRLDVPEFILINTLTPRDHPLTGVLIKVVNSSWSISWVLCALTPRALWSP